MTLKDYLRTKPPEETFDIIPAKYIGRTLHEYEDKKIKIIKTDAMNITRKIILLEE